MSRFVPGVGKSTASLMIVGEAPGFYEDREGLPFVGPSGNYLDKLLRDNDVSRDDIYLTNVIKHRPPQNDFKRLDEVCDYEAQLEILRQEIIGVRPNCILALGAEAIKALTGRSGKIKDLRGSILKSKYGPKVVCTYHPAALLRSENQAGPMAGALPYWMRYIVNFDFKRAIEHARTPIYSPPQRILRIARSSADVWNYLHRYSDREYNSVDIEALNCHPICVGFALSKADGISIPLFQRIHGIQISTIPHSDLAECWKLIGLELASKRKVIGQNFKYDQDKLEKLGFKIGNFYADSMLISHTLNPEFYKGLAFNTSLYTEEPFYKDEGKEFNPKKDNIDDYLKYNVKDCCVTLEIVLEQIKELREDGLYDFYFNYVHLLHALYLEIENVGLRIDFQRREKLSKKYREKCIELLGRMKDVLRSRNFDPTKFNPRSPKQVAFALYDVLGIPRRVGTGEEVLFSLLANTVKDESSKIFVKSVLDYRKSAKTIGTYINAAPDYDGRMRTSYRICGTETGRSSTSILEAPLRPNNIGIALQTMTKHGDIGSELRSQYIPDEGMIFLEVDLSQAEPRMVALLSEDDELLKLFDSVDIHRWTANLALGIPMGKISKNSGERHIGKVLRNAGNLGIGKHEFMIHCNTMAAKYEVKDWQDISEWKSGQLLDKFHEFTPKVKNVFHAGVRKCLMETRVLINPFGRRRIFHNSLDDEKTFKEANAQLLQSTVRDQVGHAMLDIKKEIPDLKIALEQHDAFKMMVPENDYESYAKLAVSLLERPIDFAGCSLPRGVLYPRADAQIGKNWKDMVELKL